MKELCLFIECTERFIYTLVIGRKRKVCLGLASKRRQSPSEKYQITRLLSAVMHTLASCYLSTLLKAFLCKKSI